MEEKGDGPYTGHATRGDRDEIEPHWDITGEELYALHERMVACCDGQGLSQLKSVGSGGCFGSNRGESEGVSGVGVGRGSTEGQIGGSGYIDILEDGKAHDIDYFQNGLDSASTHREP